MWRPREENMRLRSQRIVETKEWAGVNRMDIGDVLVMLAHEYDENKEARKKYVRSKSKNKGNEDRIKFQEATLRSWVRTKNAEIRTRILDRLSQELGMQ